MLDEARGMVKRTYELWRHNNAPQVAAALTYYILLSTAPLLVVLVGVLGEVLGRSAVADRVIAQASLLAGPLGAEVVRELSSAAAPAVGSGAISLTAGLVAVFGAMRVFGELRATFNRMWNVPQDEPPEGSLWKKARWFLGIQGRRRLRAFGMVVLVGLVFTASLLASSALTVLASAVPPILPVGPGAVRLLDATVSFVLVTLLFAVVYRYLPRVRIAWRDVWPGATVTAVLFVLGRVVLGLYFGYATPGSAYGAAGSLVALLVWVNLSTQLALFGAEFTYLWAHERGTQRHELSRTSPSLTRS